MVLIFPLKQAVNSIAGQNGQSIFFNRRKISFPAHVRGVLDYQIFVPGFGDPINPKTALRISRRQVVPFAMRTPGGGKFNLICLLFFQSLLVLMISN